MEVLDEDSSSLQAMASAPLMGRTVCANCGEEIVDKYLLKVNHGPVVFIARCFLSQGGFDAG